LAVSAEKCRSDAGLDTGRVTHNATARPARKTDAVSVITARSRLVGGGVDHRDRQADDLHMIVRCVVGTLAVVMLLVGVASADRGDLERQIAGQEAGLSDLRALDRHRRATEELAMLGAWLDEAKNRMREGKQSLVRELLDRMLAQGTLIRQQLAVGQLQREVQKRQTALTELRNKVKALARAIEDARARKKALEMKVK
jgi:hypothetical protein